MTPQNSMNDTGSVNYMTPNSGKKSGSFLADFNQSLKNLESVVNDNENKSGKIKQNQQKVMSYLSNLSNQLKELSQQLPELRNVIDKQDAVIAKHLETMNELSKELDASREEIVALNKEKEYLEKEIAQQKQLLNQITEF